MSFLGGARGTKLSPPLGPSAARTRQDDGERCSHGGRRHFQHDERCVPQRCARQRRRHRPCPTRTPQAAAALTREKFLPVTRHALMDRLTQPGLWPNGDAGQARRFMRYLDYWRRHSYAMKLLDLEQVYEPFSPDTDLLHTRTFSAEERQAMQKRLVARMCGAAGAGQLHARRSVELPRHPDQGLPLRPRPAGGRRRIRGGADLLPRRDHQHGAPSRHQEGLPRLAREEGAGVPAPLHPVQAEAVRRARAGGDAGKEGRQQGGGRHRQAAAQAAAGNGQQRLRLHQAVQEHAAQRRGDDLSQHQSEIPPVRQDQVRRHRRQRPGRRRRRHGRRRSRSPATPTPW